MDRRPGGEAAGRGRGGVRNGRSVRSHSVHGNAVSINRHVRLSAALTPAAIEIRYRLAGLIWVLRSRRRQQLVEFVLQGKVSPLGANIGPSCHGGGGGGRLGE